VVLATVFAVVAVVGFVVVAGTKAQTEEARASAAYSASRG
jgi:hypothetical protein